MAGARRARPYVVAMPTTPPTTQPPTTAGAHDDDVEGFASEARTWLAANAATAPRDYGAITPPDLIGSAIEWQRRIAAAGFAGIHWPIEHGGRGLSPQHNAAWLQACAEASVPPVLNMVGLVLTGGAILRFGT